MSSHLTHQQMLAYLDGELSKSEMSAAGEHLHSCWTCRIEMERLEGDIAVILDAHTQGFTPAIPPPSAAWPTFNAMIAKKLPAKPQPFLARIRASVVSVLTPARAVVFVGLIAATGFVLYLKFDSQPVSAHEALKSIRFAEEKRNVPLPGSVIRQRVHIRRTPSGQQQAQVGSIDAWKSAKATVWETSFGKPAVDALKQEYRSRGVKVELPLSELAFETWENNAEIALAAGAPARLQQAPNVPVADVNLILSKSGDNIDLTYTPAASNTAASQAMNAATLRVCPSDWRIKSLKLQFADATYEITEDDFSWVPESSVPPVLLAELEPGPLAPILKLPPSSSALAGESIRLPIVDLEKAQLDVLMTLHNLHADLGEPVTVTRTHGNVEVGVWQLSPERQTEIDIALQSEAGVVVLFKQPSQRISVTSRAQHPPEAVSSTTRITVAPEDEDERLIKFFGSAERQQAFTKAALDKSTAALSHLYALRNLQAQYPPERELALSIAERLQLRSIIRDHASAAEKSVSGLRTQMLPLDNAFHVPTSPNPEVTSYGERWQDVSLDALGTARSADHLIRELFTADDSSATVDDALPELKRKLDRISSWVQDLQKKPSQ